MKRIKFSLLVLILVACFMQFQPLARASSQREVVFAQQGQEQLSQSSLVLLYSPQYIAANDNYIFVYDSYDSLIKCYQTTSLDLRQDNPTLTASDVVKLHVADDLLFVLKNNPYVVEVYDANNFSEIAQLNTTNAPTIANANNFAVYKTSENNITVVLTKFDEINLENSIEVFNLQNSEGSWQFSNTSITINASRDLTLKTPISHIEISPSSAENEINLVFSSDNSVYYMAINPTEQALNNYPFTNLELGITEQILDVVRLNYNENSYLAVICQNEIRVYKENFSSNYTANYEFRYTFASSLSHNFTSFGNLIYISDNLNQCINLLSLTGTDQDYTLTFDNQELISNDELSTVDIEPQNFTYYRTVSATNIYQTPFSTSPILEISEGEMVCEIKDVKIGEIYLEDFVYCIYTSNSQNYYGFIKTTDLLQLEQSSFNLTQVKVYSNTNLYKLPSRLVDDTNTKLSTFSTVTTLTVISNTVNNNYIAGDDKFILVQTQDGTIGFVESLRTLASSGVQTMVSCNATITHQTNVYLEDNDDSAVIDTINEGQRVKIEDGQSTNARYIKITYNNASGEEITGYVLADNVSRDSWSTLQIIGLVFVGLNVIFLIVLLFVKKKINHD